MKFAEIFHFFWPKSKFKRMNRWEIVWWLHRANNHSLVQYFVKLTVSDETVWQVGSKKFGWNVILIIAIRKIVNSREWHFGFYVCRILAFRDFITSRFRHLGGLTSSQSRECRRKRTSSELEFSDKIFIQAVRGLAATIKRQIVGFAKNSRSVCIICQGN